MEFILLGFDQSASTRQFKFEIIAGRQARTYVTVAADLALAREYEIQLQNLPLLCRELLEHSDAAGLSGAVVTLTETYMAESSKAARQAREQKKPRRVKPPVSSKMGSAWRTPIPPANR